MNSQNLNIVTLISIYIRNEMKQKNINLPFFVSFSRFHMNYSPPISHIAHISNGSMRIRASVAELSTWHGDFGGAGAVRKW